MNINDKAYAFKDALIKWKDFKGKTNKENFWIVKLAIYCIYAILVFIVISIYELVADSAGKIKINMSEENFNIDTSDVDLESILIMGAVFLFLLIFVSIINFSLTSRRLRDAGSNPALTYVYIFPIIGSIIILTLCNRPSVDDDGNIIEEEEPLFDFDNYTPIDNRIRRSYDNGYDNKEIFKKESDLVEETDIYEEYDEDDEEYFEIEEKNIFSGPENILDKNNFAPRDLGNRNTENIKEEKQIEHRWRYKS